MEPEIVSEIRYANELRENLKYLVDENEIKDTENKLIQIHKKIESVRDPETGHFHQKDNNTQSERQKSYIHYELLSIRANIRREELIKEVYKKFIKTVDDLLENWDIIKPDEKAKQFKIIEELKDKVFEVYYPNGHYTTSVQHYYTIDEIKFMCKHIHNEIRRHIKVLGELTTDQKLIEELRIEIDKEN